MNNKENTLSIDNTSSIKRAQRVRRRRRLLKYIERLGFRRFSQMKHSINMHSTTIHKLRSIIIQYEASTQYTYCSSCLRLVNKEIALENDDDNEDSVHKCHRCKCSMCINCVIATTYDVESSSYESHIKKVLANEENDKNGVVDVFICYHCALAINCLSNTTNTTTTTTTTTTTNTTTNNNNTNSI